MVSSTGSTDRILGEQVRLAIKQLPAVQITSFIIALILSFTVRNIIPHAKITTWLMMILVIVIGRTVLYYRFMKVDERSLVAEYWERVYLLLAFFSGIVWGLSAFIIFPVGNVWLMTVFLIAMAGLTAGTTVSHTGIKLGSTAWVVPVMLLYAIRCVMEGREFEYILGLFIVTFMAAIIAHSLRNNESITSSISLKFENIDLLNAARESEERFRVLAGASFEGVVFSREGIIMDCNEQLLKILGFSKEELIDKPIRDLLPSEDIERVMNNISSGREVIIGHDLLCKDGSRRSVEAHGTATIFQGKEYRITTIHDITESKRAKDALKNSELIFRSITTTASDAILLMDDGGKIIYWNPAAERIFGYSAQEAIGNHLHILLSPKRMHDAYQQGFARFVETGHGSVVNKTIEITAVNKEGREFPIEISTSAMRINDHWHALGIIRDITERIKAAEDLKRLNELLSCQATTDPLTGIPNRSKFDELFSKEILRSKRFRLFLSVIIFDIDHFKIINDTYGHNAGDCALQYIAGLVAKVVRRHDLFARWGGEEFLIMVTNTQLHGAELFAEKLRLMIEKFDFPEVGHLTCSFGVAEFAHDDNDDSLINRADQALYRAKAGGRNRVESIFPLSH